MSALSHGGGPARRFQRLIHIGEVIPMTYSILRTKTVIFEQRMKIEAPHAEAAIQSAENDDGVPRKWTPISKVNVTKILRK